MNISFFSPNHRYILISIFSFMRPPFINASFHPSIQRWSIHLFYPSIHPFYPSIHPSVCQVLLHPPIFHCNFFLSICELRPVKTWTFFFNKNKNLMDEEHHMRVHINVSVEQSHMRTLICDILFPSSYSHHTYNVTLASKRRSR